MCRSLFGTLSIAVQRARDDAEIYPNRIAIGDCFIHQFSVDCPNPPTKIRVARALRVPLVDARCRPREDLWAEPDGAGSKHG